MLMHEWIRYRNQQVKPGSEVTQPVEAAEPAESEEEARPDVEAAEGLKLAAEEVEAEEPAGGADEARQAEPRAQAAPPATDSTERDRREVLASLEEEVERAGEGIRERLHQLQARQRQLPIEIEEPAEEPQEDRPRRASETRQELVQRLLDPTLTLRESALLLDVCPTTVRRYTNRGLLKCFRTPGNQRRFRLADVLDFMERREQGEL